MKKSLIILLLFAVLIAKAQVEEMCKLPLTFSVFVNTTLMPPRVVESPFHPGLTAGTYLVYNDNDKNEVFQSFHLGGFYHKYSMTALQLYTNFGYRRIFLNSFGLEASLHAGYFHSFPDIQAFILNDQGQYEPKANKTRSQFMTGIDLGLFYKIKKKDARSPRIFLNYQFYLEMPFVSGYVPFLPNNSLHLGTVLYFNNK